MSLPTIARVLGMLIAMYSVTMIAPMAVAFIYEEQTFSSFAMTGFFTILLAALIYVPTASYKESTPKLKDGFIIVVLYWVSLGLIGTLPFHLTLETAHLGFSDTLFESFSGLTTTGATVFTNLETLPKSLLFYRQQLQWYGGMGIIVLAIAVLPTLGVGGQFMFKAELASPMKDEKLSPRISETAKALWGIYLALTVLCAIAYKLAGMNWFEAITHSFSTISIGGFSTYDNSFAYFDSPIIESIAILFILISAVNFTLHFNAWHRRNLGGILSYFRDTETRIFLYLMAILCVICSLLLFYNTELPISDALRHGIFQTISLASTAGFTTTDWYNWPSGIPYILIFASFIGACAGSTGGGMKVIRLILLFKQGLREIIMLIHPRAIKPLRLNEQVIPERIVNTIWGFFALYVSSFLLLFLILLIAGEPPLTAFTTLSSCINNLGPAMGNAAINYSGVSITAKYVLSFAMLLGRLEFYTLVVLLTPVFWRT